MTSVSIRFIQFCVLFSSLFYYLQEYQSGLYSFVYCFQVYFILYRNINQVYTVLCIVFKFILFFTGISIRFIQFCVLFSSLFYYLQEYQLGLYSFVSCFQVYFIIYRNMFRWNQRSAQLSPCFSQGRGVHNHSSEAYFKHTDAMSDSSEWRPQGRLCSL